MFHSHHTPRQNTCLNHRTPCTYIPHLALQTFISPQTSRLLFRLMSKPGRKEKNSLNVISAIEVFTSIRKRPRYGPTYCITQRQVRYFTTIIIIRIIISSKNYYIFKEQISTEIHYKYNLIRWIKILPRTHKEYVIHVTRGSPYIFCDLDCSTWRKFRQVLHQTAAKCKSKQTTQGVKALTYAHYVVHYVCCRWHLGTGLALLPAGCQRRF